MLRSWPYGKTQIRGSTLKVSRRSRSVRRTRSWPWWSGASPAVLPSCCSSLLPLIVITSNCCWWWQSGEVLMGSRGLLWLTLKSLGPGMRLVSSIITVLKSVASSLPKLSNLCFSPADFSCCPSLPLANNIFKPLCTFFQAVRLISLGNLDNFSLWKILGNAWNWTAGSWVQKQVS